MSTQLSRLSTLLFACFCIVTEVHSEEFAVIGSRQMGMGGAGVAVTRGAMGSYWNPAGFAPPKETRVDTFWDLAIPASVNAAAVGSVLDDLDDIADLSGEIGDFNDLEDTLDDPGTQLNDAELQRILRLVDELNGIGGGGTGLVTNSSVGVAARVWYFGFSALALAYAGGVTEVDLNNLALGDEGLTGAIGGGNDRSGQLSAGGQTFADSLAAQGLATQNQAEEIVFQAEQGGVSVTDSAFQQNVTTLLDSTQDNIGGDLDEFFSQNQSGVNLRGIIVQEYGVSFAYPFFDIVSVGATAKLLYGMTYFQPLTLSTIENSDDLAGELLDSDNVNESVNYGIDLGVLLQPFEILSLGVVARNINRPRFDFDGPGDYTLEPQLRGGVGFEIPYTGLLLAVDIDLVENNSEALVGYESQVVGGGIEWVALDILMLRVGASKNLSRSDESMQVHAGLGLRLAKVQIEIAGSMSPDFAEIGGNDVPERAGGSLFLGINVPLD